MANAGSVYNTIPAAAMAIGDMRADAPDDFKAVEAAIRERTKNRLIPDTTVDVRFETVFPPMPFSPASLPLAEHVQRLYAEAGGTAKINRVSIDAGTDAAFAALNTKAPVIEGTGLSLAGWLGRFPQLAHPCCGSRAEVASCTRSNYANSHGRLSACHRPHGTIPIPIIADTMTLSSIEAGAATIGIDPFLSDRPS
jgi:metal-dependent amidase/aminoacylase/carboxypeptidase family protein